MPNGRDGEMLGRVLAANAAIQRRLARLEGEHAALAKSASASSGEAATAGHSAMGMLRALQGRVYSLERFRLSQTVCGGHGPFTSYVPARRLMDEEIMAVASAIMGGPGIVVVDNRPGVDLADDPGLEFHAAGNAGKLRMIRATARYNAMVANDADLIFKSGWIRAH